MKDKPFDNENRNRYYGLRVGDIVHPIYFNNAYDRGNAEVIAYTFDNNRVRIKWLANGEETDWVAEHCEIVTKVEDRK